MPAAGFAELVLVVEDVQRAARFYQNALGLVPERPADESWAWFWVGEPGVEQRLALHKGPLLFEEHSPRPPGDRWGPVHFALRVERNALAAALARAERHECQVYGPVHFDWMGATSHYLYDPDGNLVEFWSPDSPVDHEPA